MRHLDRYRVRLGRLVPAPMDERAVDVDAVGGAVLRQRQRLVAVRGLTFDPLQYALGLSAGANADYIRPGHGQKIFQRVWALDLKL